MAKATFGAGCFWGVELRFQQVPGVTETAVGYEGGKLDNPTYRDVCSDGTGHAEVVEIDFDPSKVSYQTLLDLFFELHDPTQLNRQGPDEGTQYRSSIFFGDPLQQKIATAYITQLDQAHVFARPVVTRVDPLKGFYPAEGYHQDYLVRNPHQPYIVYNDLPKVENLKRVFPDIYLDKPVLTRDNNVTTGEVAATLSK